MVSIYISQDKKKPTKQKNKHHNIEEKWLYFFLLNSWIDQRITQGSNAERAAWLPWVMSNVHRVLTFCRSQTPPHLWRPGVPTSLPVPWDKCSPFPTFEPVSLPLLPPEPVREQVYSFTALVLWSAIEGVGSLLNPNGTLKHNSVHTTNKLALVNLRVASVC